jgi:L-seryl-tRNA(Ser) seleniumtransferase
MSRARVIPAVDHLLGLPAVQALAAAHGPRRVRQALDEEIDRLRAALVAGQTDAATRESAGALIVERLQHHLGETSESSLRPVINATGVIIHTNLGRAPLSPEALDAMRRVGAGYATLEFDLATGQRGTRHQHLTTALREATGAEAGVATNNTAAGLTLTLAAIAAGREVILSRGELVEIGGGFRIPEILQGSGARLREVGTTNRTRVADYGAAISERTGAILRVHPSNFRMEGFTERPALAELAALARRFSIPLIEDQGSGWLGLDLFATHAFPAEARLLLAREPAVRDSIRDGADLVAFSADKLLGGPQAGLVVGRADLIARLGRHPLMRAVRVDKTTYAGLEATLRAFTSGRAAETVPVVRMLALPLDAIARRATRLVDLLRASGVECDTAAGLSTIGGGSLPGETLSTRLVRLDTGAPDRVLAALRAGRPPLIARIVDDRVCLDLRTVPEVDDDVVVRAVRDVMSAPRP